MPFVSGLHLAKEVKDIITERDVKIVLATKDNV